MPERPLLVLPTPRLGHLAPSCRRHHARHLRRSAYCGASRPLAGVAAARRRKMRIAMQNIVIPRIAMDTRIRALPGHDVLERI